jgi:hypothetical protein
MLFLNSCIDEEHIIPAVITTVIAYRHFCSTFLFEGHEVIERNYKVLVFNHTTMIKPIKYRYLFSKTLLEPTQQTCQKQVAINKEFPMQVTRLQMHFRRILFNQKVSFRLYRNPQLIFTHLM